MSDILSLIVAQWQQQSVSEIFAVLLAIAYVWFAAEQKIWCWPAALVSTSLYTYIFWDVTLVFQMALNAYYAIMAVVGWLSWRKAGQLTVTRVQRMAMWQHIVVLSLGVLLTVLVVVFASHWLNYEMLWLDAGITMMSLIVTWLTVRKYLESWVYWSVINGASIVLFISVDLYLSVCLMLIYIVLAAHGFMQWRNSVDSSANIGMNKGLEEEVSDIAKI